MTHTKTQNTAELTPELLERARAGDRDVLTELYEATELEVYRTVHAILRDEELCRDVQQETYLRAFSRLEELRDPAAFLPWLRQIAVNEARMQLRKKRPLLFSELSDEPDAGEPELTDLRPEASPELSFEQKENARLVREILDGLSDGQRLLLGMFYYEQIPIKQIAADTGLSEGTVKTQLHRGRKRVEAAVKRLEEKGVKLYGLTPLPFLLALLKHQTPAAGAEKTLMTETFAKAGIAPAAGTSSAAGVSSASAVGASTAAGSAAATAETAVYVGRTFFQTALGKVILGLIAAGLVAGGAAGLRWARANHVFGDYRPPTETLDILLHHDSDEDLPTEHSTEPTLDTETPTTPDTAEDLPTEPVETSEPTDPTDPVDPTEPEETTDPVGADDHIGPDPKDPTDPTTPVGAGDHTGPDPTEEPTTEPKEEPTDPTEPTEESTYETLPTENPYPDALGEIHLTQSDENVWSYSFPSNVEMDVSQFVFSSTNISGILVDSTYQNGVQTITVQPRTEGTCPIGIRIPGLYWYKLATIIVTSAEN